MNSPAKHPFRSVLLREINRIRSQWIYIFSAIILPVVGFVLLTAIFQSGVARELNIAVVDKDQSAFSREIRRAVNATSIAHIAETANSESSCYKMMQQGKIHAFVVIPERASAKVLKNEEVPVALYVDNTNIVTGGLLTNGIRSAIASVSGKVKVSSYLQSGKNAEQARALAQPIRINDHVLFNPFGSYAFFLLTGLLPLMLVVFVLLSSIHSLGTELKYGTAKPLLETAGGSIRIAVAGKLLPFSLIYLLHAFIMNYILFFYIGTPMNGNFTTIVISEFILIIAYQMMAVFAIAITYNMRLSLSLASAYSMMALTFAGLTFPHIGMPAVARWFSYIFPYRFWLEAFIGQALRAEPIGVSMEALLLTSIFILVGLLCLPLLKKRFTNERFYGKI